MYKIIGADLKEYGPVSAQEVRQWVTDGRANGQTLTQLEGSGEWRPLGLFPEFAGLTGPQPPPVLGATSRSAPAAASILAGNPDFDLGECLSGGLSLFLNHFGLLAGATLLIWIIDSAILLVPQLGGLLSPLFGGVLYGGLYLVYLKCLRGQPTNVGEALAGFKFGFPQLLLAGFLTWVFITLGFMLCLLPGLYLVVAYSFSLLLVADKQLEFWSAMEMSRKVSTRVWFKLFLLLAVAFLPFLLFQGYVTLENTVKTFPLVLDMMKNIQSGVAPDLEKLATMEAPSAALVAIGRLVLLLCLPLSMGAVSHAYENLFGSRRTPSA
jgi:uncharacterized membrane protein